jgi:hypothetical protein
MKCDCCLSFVIALWAALLPAGMFAQSADPVPLGDVARSLHQAGKNAAPVVIDNDNLSQVMAESESRRTSGSPEFSVQRADNTFRVSLPDGTCSLSFNANATSLLLTPSVIKELPEGELAKLEGPASINGDTLQVALYNATDWDLKEITVGLTLARPTHDKDEAFYGAARFVPASAQEDPAPLGKPADRTWILRLEGTAAPLETAIFREKLGVDVSPEQEWHWAILQAKGIPPRPLSIPPESQSSAFSPLLP